MRAKLLKRTRREFNRRYKVSVIVNDRIGYRATAVKSENKVYFGTLKGCSCRIRKKVIYNTFNKHIYDMSIKKELIFNIALKIMNHERIRPNYIQ